MSEIASMVPLIEKLQMDGITLIMIEHRLRELFRVASGIMVLNFGQKLTEGIPEEVMQDERVKKLIWVRKRPQTISEDHIVDEFGVQSFGVFIKHSELLTPE